MDSTPTDRTRLARLDGRWIVVAILLGYFALVGSLTRSEGYEDAWRWFGVPGLLPPFADLHGLTAAADSYRAGHDPLVDNPEDRWKRSMNYPRAWLLPLLAFGIHQRDTLALGLGLGAAFFGCALLYMGEIRWRQGVLWGVLLCAPPVMLAVERGNNDVFIFILLALALLALRREGARPWPAYATVGLCAVLKLYPVCAFMLAWREPPRRALLILAAAGAGFAAYLYGTRDDLRVIQAAVPRATVVAYGSRVYFDWLAVRQEPHGTTAPWPALSALAVVSAALLARVRLPGPAPLPRAEADGLMVGGAMYAVTFALNSNFNYRLIVLLFAVPALLRLRESAEISYRCLGNGLLAAMTVGWLVTQIPVTNAFLIKEAANWIVFGGIVFLLWQFLPLPTAADLTGGRVPGRCLRWAKFY